jgi:trans-aconitate 2-methyltransferase
VARWDPGQYNKFADHRQRPAFDLMAQIAVDDAGSVVDLGCGTGELTAALADRWPRARVLGIDSSPDMLAKARALTESSVGRRLAFAAGDVASWQPESALDVVFSNACLHWVDDHDRLFPRLFGWLAPGGVLAVQMPRMASEPSHRLMADVAANGPWRDRLAPVLRPEPVATPAHYCALLRPLASRVDIWETIYQQELDGDDPVLSWTKGTALRPLLQALDGPQQRQEFEAAYAARLRAAYPMGADGKTLFPFRRLFIVARR